MSNHRIENNAPHGYINEETGIWSDDDPREGFEGTEPQEYAYPWRAATEEEAEFDRRLSLVLASPSGRDALRVILDKSLKEYERSMGLH